MKSTPELTAPESSPQNTAVRLGERRRRSPLLSEQAARQEMGRRSRRAFFSGALAAVLGGYGYWWLRRPAQEYLFRRVFRLNEKISEQTFTDRELAPEFPRERVSSRLNGMEGLTDNFDPLTWSLQVSGLPDAKKFPNFSEQLQFSGQVKQEIEDKFPAAPVAGLNVTLAEIQALPRIDLTTELKCIEGWSVVVHWTGARFSDFAEKYMPRSRYVSLVTPDRGYYVGWDLPSILHPQTLLCYAMNGAPLTLAHGAPLRLVSTTKYGIKQIKRIGRITFTDERPPDFWAEQGYDWYSGL